MPRITIDIPDHLHKELKQAAKANTRSMSGEILHRLTHGDRSINAQLNRLIREAKEAAGQRNRK